MMKIYIYEGNGKGKDINIIFSLLTNKLNINEEMYNKETKRKETLKQYYELRISNDIILLDI
jgi:hypothetical protein